MIERPNSQGEHTQQTRIVQALQFVKKNVAAVLGISVLVLIPCFWHANIQAGDLASHTYNAWLAELIAAGKAPGLYLAPQRNNMLVDVALANLGNLVGLRVAERIVVSVVVLVFFWGAFAFISALGKAAPWALAPAIAMVTYGWTFQMGFLNYYLSLGIAFFAAALCSRAREWDWAIVFGCAVLALLAHPMGFLWLVGSVAYISLARRSPDKLRAVLFVAALCAVFGVHWYTAHRYKVHEAVGRTFVRFNGTDQFVLYGTRYRMVAVAVLLISACALLTRFRELRNREFWPSLRVPVELWLILIFAVAMLWEGITIPGYAMSVGFLPERFTSITAVVALCVLASLKPAKWLVYSLCAIAAIFFLWMYQDTSVLNRMEEHASELVSTLPYGSRVVATIWTAPGSRVAALQTVDRPCIARCFDYSNYEPSTKQFRVRAEQGNLIAVASSADGLAMREGRYVVLQKDLPLTEIYQCDPVDLSRLCLRPLVAGERTGRIGYQPPTLH